MRERAPWLKELGAKRLERGVGRIQKHRALDGQFHCTRKNFFGLPHPGQDGHDYMADGSISFSGV